MQDTETAAPPSQTYVSEDAVPKRTMEHVSLLPPRTIYSGEKDPELQKRIDRRERY